MAKTKEEKFADYMVRVLSVTPGDWETTSFIVRRCNNNYDKCKKALELLVDEGRVERWKPGFDTYWRIKK